MNKYFKGTSLPASSNNPAIVLSDLQSPHVVDLEITGMSCASCVSRVEKALAQIAGVQSVAVNLASEKARVILALQKVTTQELADEVVQQILTTLKKIGYQGRLIDDDQSAPAKSTLDDRQRDLRREKIKVVLSLVLTAPLILPMVGDLFGFHIMLPGLWQLFLATPVQFWLGAKFYKGAWGALKELTGNMDLLVSLGTSAAYGLSVFHLLLANVQGNHGSGSLFFESSAAVVSFVLLGKYLESRAKMQTRKALTALNLLRPQTARVRQSRDGFEIPDVEIPISRLMMNDVVVIRPGEVIAADGIIEEGRSMVDESMLTGESLPILRTVGHKVWGGALNHDGMLLVKVTSLGKESFLGRLISMVENAQAGKAPVQRLVDQVSAVFVPIVVILALVTLIAWGLYDGIWDKAVINAVSVLVIACPCALGLATPAAIMVGTGCAARAGILIRDPEVLELAHRITMVAFDKTGTLTEGHPQVERTLTADGVSEEDLFILAAAVQQGSEHPLARATIKEHQRRGYRNELGTNIVAIPGYGVEGQVRGLQIVIGSQRLIEERFLEGRGDTPTFVITEKMLASASSGSAAFVVDVNNRRLMGVIRFNDTIRAEARTAIDQIKNLGVVPLMITGDHEKVAETVANALGIDEFYASVLPQDKVNIVTRKMDQGEIVAMVGDGINDAPALAAANVGMAMGTGTDVAVQTAGLILMRGNPLLIPDALAISRLTYRKIKQNLFWAFVYNLIFLPIAAAGLLSPAIAGAAMAMSSVSVLGNALLLNRWRPLSALRS